MPEISSPIAAPLLAVAVTPFRDKSVGSQLVDLRPWLFD